MRDDASFKFDIIIRGVTLYLLYEIKINIIFKFNKYKDNIYLYI
jgi:hypothetical protein